VLAASAVMHGCTFETTVMGKSAGIVQSPEAVARVAEVARSVSGIHRVHDGWSIGGGDDATFMMKRVQEHGGKAAYFLIGSDIPAVHHAVDFDIDEASLEHGVSLFAGLVQSILGDRA
jgi:aminobenzoyl-glutamate utilization protein A